MKARIALALAASLGLAACQGDGPLLTESSPVSAAATQDDLFTLAPDAALNGAQRDLLATIRGRRSTGEVNLARLSGQAARMLQHGRAVRFMVAPGRPVVAVGDRVEQGGPGGVSWSGGVPGGNGLVSLVMSDAGVTASIHSGGTLYHVEPLGGGLHAISRVDVANLPPDHPADSDPAGAEMFAGPRLPESPFDARSPFQASLAASTQTVLVVYTAAAAAASGNIGNLISLAVDETNTGYQNSLVGITSLRVHTAQVTYNEANRSFSQHTTALRSSTDGIMDDVHTLRNTYGADLVVLVVNDSEACGQAAAIQATATTAFAVAHYTCITGYYSFAHEIGHLQGARHDRAVDSALGSAHGYVDPNGQWRTIMAYGNACNNCTRVNYWSNPNVIYPLTGQPMGTILFENNAGKLNSTAATVAAFR
jgi:hypothetical protein